MADITMCKGNECPLKFECYRFTAFADDLLQPYFVSIPYDKDKKECKMFWDTNVNKKLKV